MAEQADSAVTASSEILKWRMNGAAIRAEESAMQDYPAGHPPVPWIVSVIHPRSDPMITPPEYINRQVVRSIARPEECMVILLTDIRDFAELIRDPAFPTNIVTLADTFVDLALKGYDFNAPHGEADAIIPLT